HTATMLPVMFRSYPYRSQFSYADALQREGIFDDVSKTAWEEGYRDWVYKFGQERYPFPGGGGSLRLDMTEQDIRDDARAQNIDVDELRDMVIRMHGETRYPYWKARSLAEAARVMIDAHKAIYDGQLQFRKGNLKTARELLLQGMTLYEQLFKKYEV